MQSKEEVKLGGEAMSLSAELSCLQVGGGAEREASLASLEKQLICPICLEIFNKPVVILPCQHNLCRKCANELYQPSLFQARTTMMVNSGRFRCPSCRHEVVLDRHGVYGLQRNLLVENIIDVYKQEVSCCISSPVPLPPSPTSLSAQLTCSDHEGEKVNIYCLSCQVPTCSLCKVFGAHQKCKVAPLTDVYQQRKDELCEGISALKTFNSKVQALINELEETCKIIEENSKTEKQNVCDKFDSMLSLLKERQKVMTQRITSEQEEKTGHVKALSCCYGNNVEANNKLLETVKSNMEEPDIAAFVQNSKELISKVLSASSSSSYETLKPGYENLSHYRFNFSKQKRALKSIAFVKVVEDVPEELEVNSEIEESREPSIQGHKEPKQSQETSIQNLEPAVDPVKEPAIVLTSTSVNLRHNASSLAQTLPHSGLVRESLEASVGTKEQNNVRPGQINAEENQEPERCITPDAVKEGNQCEYQDGMSTQQAVTLLFYLLAFLLILQRVWAYIGCFICT